MVQGCLAWQEKGLSPPETVKAATKEYRVAEDLLSQFIEERCVIGDKYQVKGGDFFKAYQRWSEEMGLISMSGTKFGTEMKRRFDHYTKGYVFYMGLELRDLEG